jgi:hypothetical protein
VRAIRAATLLLCTVAAASCGGSDPSSDPARALTPVRLTVIAPTDSATTRTTSVTVRGSVDPPDATVLVLGRRAGVVAGAFSAQVDLDPGTNVIDLAATAPGRGPALTAVRITREMPVAVPDLGGLTADAARKRVAAIGLTLDEKDAGGLLESILPGDPGVCEQDPGAGDAVTRGTVVHVVMSKRC